MTRESQKYKTQGSIAYPHIGRFLAQHFANNRINRSALSRDIGVAESTSTDYLKRQSLQLGILWKISVALKHNFFADLALLLPIAFSTPREKELEMQLEDSKKEILKIQQEVNDLKIQNEAFRSVLIARQ